MQYFAAFDATIKCTRAQFAHTNECDGQIRRWRAHDPPPRQARGGILGISTLRNPRPTPIGSRPPTTPQAFPFYSFVIIIRRAFVCCRALCITLSREQVPCEATRPAIYPSMCTGVAGSYHSHHARSPPAGASVTYAPRGAHRARRKRQRRRTPTAGRACVFAQRRARGVEIRGPRGLSARAQAPGKAKADAGGFWHANKHVLPRVQRGFVTGALG